MLRKLPIWAEGSPDAKRRLQIMVARKDAVASPDRGCWLKMFTEKYFTFASKTCSQSAATDDRVYTARVDRHLAGEHEPGYNPRLTMGSAPLKTGRSTFPT